MKKSARNKKTTKIFGSKVEAGEKPEIVAEIIHEEKKPTGFKKFVNNKPLFIGAVIVLFIALTAGGIYLLSYFAEDAVIPQAKETEKIMAELDKIFLLPSDETPTVLAVTDIAKLAGQPFFAKAQNGDKVILFGGIKQAILYRPSIKKIINMSPINPDSIPQKDNTSSASAATTPTNQPKEKIKVAVLNATQEVGLARKGSNLLDDEVFDVIATSNANGEYENTIVSVVNGSKINDSDLALISKNFSKVDVKKLTLPTDEPAPAGAEIVIILGSDFSEAY